MKSLYTSRLSSHLTEMFKYLRLVFNDYFVLALLFLIGGLGYSYSNLLKTLSGSEWWLMPLCIVVITLVEQLGNLATLIREPDFVFLLPREGQMWQYFKTAFSYSFPLAAIIQLVVTVVLMPLIHIGHVVSILQVGALLLTVVAIKGTLLVTDLGFLYRLVSKRVKQLIHYVLPLIVLTIGLYFNYFIAFGISLAALLGATIFSGEIKNRPLNWREATATENGRMHRVYQFFNLFTDVPALTGNVKRRKWLDPLLKRIELIPKNTYKYLYAHGIIRDNEMSGLFFRLTLIGAVMLFFIHGTYLPIMISALFIYLIGFQLIPFYQHFDDNVFIHIYPVTLQNKTASFQTVIRWMLVIVAVIFAIVVIFANIGSFATIVGVIMVELLELVWFLRMYLPRRVQKITKA
ncbi:ABC transporter permease [Lentilactobacillus senioris]|uniref:ABC transporter permease n=1 Tax=Lentilactobacillus senioris TaxID=931534 RepID=UPI00227F9FEF|nr:ABC transporter permease [Lentilactobacillus senioris]MCY9806971.1 ABC transporter permease [Lentilactobacillus senioris]